MLLWSIPFLLIDFKHSGFHLGMITAFIGGCSVFYFIILIIEFYILTPVIQRASLPKSLIISSLITLGGIVLLVYLMHVMRYNIPIYLNGTPFVLWLVFYVLGVKFYNGVPFRWWFLPLALFFLLCSLGETYFYSTIGKVAHGIKISSHFYSAFVILIVLSKEFREKFVRIFESIKIIQGISWLGRQSFFVYLSHMLVIPIANKICRGGGLYGLRNGL
jgi:fucose 4-O-acetylase-like acetyltransferase